MPQDEKESGNYRSFRHEKCEYFPCHGGIEDGDFSCLFCYCPLYFLGRDCGGNFRYTESGVKDCSDCLFPHRRSNYDRMMERIGRAIEKARNAEKD